MSSYKQWSEEYQKRHKAFLEFYWKEQMEHVIKFSLIVGILGLLCLIFAVPVEHPNYLFLGYLKYSLSAFGDFGFVIFAWWLIKTERFDESKKAVIAEKFSFIFGIINLGWGNYAMEITLLEKGVRNPLMLVAILSIVTAILYYPWYHYLIMLMIGFFFLDTSFIIHSGITIDVTSILCSIFIMIMLFNLGIARYVYGRDRFEKDKQNAELLQETETQNEELIAGNQELTAVNEELNNTTDRLSEALAEIEAAAKSQKMFTNSMNHELRAPLNGIIGNLQVMLMNEKLPVETVTELNECMNMSRSLLGIVNDLLDFAKMDAGELKIIPETFDLHDLVDNLTGMFKNTANGKGLEYITEIPDDMICGLYGDDGRIQQVLVNLMSNAVKYTEKGYVKISMALSDDKLVCKVSDSGQGMAEESLNDLFLPYKRIAEDKNRNIQGTGLGMSIVKTLIDLMEGTIDVSSTLGRGTVFTVSFPIKVSDASNTWKASEKSSDAIEEKSLKADGGDRDFTGLRILYVDDTKLNLKIIQKLMADTGVMLECCQDPEEGLKMAMDNQYDLLFIDHQMPKLDGPGLFEKIRKSGGINAVTPAVIFTGNAGAGVEGEYRQMGFAGYLLKPVLKEDLMKIVGEVVKKCTTD